jgi:hypothetical protein
LEGAAQTVYPTPPQGKFRRCHQRPVAYGIYEALREDVGLHKTRAIVSIPAMAQLKQRIEAARERRKHLSVDYPHLIIDEVAGRPFAPSGDHYCKQFTRAGRRGHGQDAKLAQQQK